MDAPPVSAPAAAMTPKRRRPIAITIVGIVLVLTSLVNLFIGSAYIWISYAAVTEGRPIDAEDLFSENPLDDPEQVLGEGVLYLILGAVQLVIAVGFWRLARWAWVAAMTWQAVKLLVEVFNFFVGDVVTLTLILSILLVLLLNQSDVRLTFRILNRPNEPPKPTIRHLDVN